jgi:glycosyltransferase involved in cell wall biosynthesis
MKHENLNNFYNELDLFVLPSYYEALGCVYLEAWAANIPVISVEGQGFSELVSENEMENLIAKKQSPESLKDRIFEEYKKRRIYVFNEKYDIRNTISEFVKLYL